MIRRNMTLVTVCAALLLSASAAVAAPTGVADIVAKMPAKNATDGYVLAQGIVKLGPAAVQEICTTLKPPGKVNDSKARFALHGLAMYVTRPGAEAERKMYVGVIRKALAGADDWQVKAFLIRQLQLAGKDDAVADLAGLLGHTDLCEPATQALIRIQTRAATAALAKALPAAKGKNQATLIRALGRLGDKSSAQAILPHATSQDAVLRQLAWYALATIGDPAIAPALSKATRGENHYDRAMAVKYYLLLARKRAAAGDKALAIRICREILSAPPAGNAVCSALSVLVDVSGKAAMVDLLAAADHKDKGVRVAAMWLAEGFRGEIVTEQWAAKAARVTPVARAEIMTMFGRRGGKSAAAALTAAMGDKDPAVRSAAIAALGRLGAKDAVGALLNVLASDRAEDVKSAKAALMSIRGEGVSAVMGERVAKASPAGKAALLELLGARGATDQAAVIFAAMDDKDATVRAAAIRAAEAVASEKDLPRLIDAIVKAKTDSEQASAQKVVVLLCKRSGGAGPVLKALPATKGKQRAALLATLARIGGAEAMKAVQADVKNSDADVKDAAVRALAAWSTPDAALAAALADIARDSGNKVHRILAIRGLGNVRSQKTLQLLAGFLDDAVVCEEAAAAAVKIACPQKKRDKGLRGPVVAKVLTKVVASTKNAGTRGRAKKHLAGMPAPKPTPAPRPKGKPLPPLGKPDKDGFVSLFNGKDLTGWIGSVDGYAVENGVLFCKPKGGGNLMTAHQFGDFILKFEFKLPPGGANNGLGIRTPAKGNAAYVGMELQILDDSAPKWANLKPYQYHGSIYGCVAAKRGHLKPQGQWNQQEVCAVGPQITVILNGATIVDADISKLDKTADGGGLKRHPGLTRRFGHIGWLGHGSKVEFRDIKIKPLDAYSEGPHNVPPKGFTAAFNGKDLTGWKGLVGNPKTRAAMPPEKLAAEQTKANERIKKHWQVVDGMLVFDGRGKALCTAKDYGDFEMYVDWKIHPGGDSGIYLRGSPQVQIWDPLQRPEGSGGLFNNKKNPSKPLYCADYLTGQWNRFYIKMIGERVTVKLNEVLIVDNVVMENYWERNKPIYPTGQIELQNHGSTLWFRNIYIREIPQKGGQK